MTPQEEEKYQQWLSTFGNFFEKDEAELFVIRKPEDINDVFDVLEDMGV